MNKGQSALVATAESIPAMTSEIRALDQSEKEYNRMISQHTTYHRMMMDDLMKLSSETGSQSITSPTCPSGWFPLGNECYQQCSNDSQEHNADGTCVCNQGGNNESCYSAFTCNTNNNSCTLPPTANPDSSCPPGWYLYGNTCVQICSNNSQTRNADGSCICNQGGNNQDCYSDFACIDNRCSVNRMNIVAGLGTTLENLDASNEKLLKTAAKYADQGKQRAITATHLNAYMNETGMKLQNDIKSYDAFVSNTQKEGFDTMDAALEFSEIRSESQKYALFIFGAFAMFLLYKTVKHL